ncbi:MAG: DUF2851 family protein [Opitutaceae bacterium]|nr:DUF2851 family protein [Opitutaceae bacterium]
MKHDGSEYQARGECSTGAVAEVQGLYGPFSFPEILLQQIWLRGEFDATRLVVADGRAVQVLHPGRWNRLGGPDFKQARLRIGGEAVTGDVEVHLHAEDWTRHRHADDPAYAGVVLHVVLFPGRAALPAVSRGAGGRGIPVATLLPLLWHDLEEYAADAAVERLARHPMARAREELLAMREDELRAELGRLASERWARKVHFAKVRVARLGWEEACHHAALEILGYRANRAPMLAVATGWPLAVWRKNTGGATAAQAITSVPSMPAGNPIGCQPASTACDGGSAGEGFADAVFEEISARGAWSQQGARPANHPRARLRQYARWVAASQDWPARLAHVFASQGSAGAAGFSLRPESASDIHGQRGPAPGEAGRPPRPRSLTRADEPSTRDWRRANGARRLRAAVGRICGGAIGGTRLDNLVCDGFLPLLAACDGADAARLERCWRHWWTGDMPAQVAPLLKGLRMTGTRDQPACHGIAQGLLGWMLANEDAAPRGEGNGPSQIKPRP